MQHCLQVASACFIQPPLCYVGLTEEEAIERLSGDIDVYSSKFKPLKNTLSGRDEKTLMKIIVQADTDTVRCPTSLCDSFLLSIWNPIVAMTEAGFPAWVQVRLIPCVWLGIRIWSFLVMSYSRSHRVQGTSIESVDTVEGPVGSSQS